MKPARFSYELPASLDEALRSLATWRDEAKVIAGGQSLAPMLNMRLVGPARLIDINNLSELGEIRIAGNSLEIGAMVRHARLARDETVRQHAGLISQVAATIGHYAIRQRGTIGGSLAHADPAAQLALAALALDAEVELRSASQTRVLPATDFLLSVFTTALEPDEILTTVRIPLSPQRSAWGFRLFNRRAGDFAIVSVAAGLCFGPDDEVQDVRIAIGGIGATPVRVDELVPPGLAVQSDRSWAARVAGAVAEQVSIEEDLRVPAVFRRELVERLTREALDEALERAS